MRTFTCENCGRLVFFENSTCLDCGAGLGFWWAEREIVTLDPDANALRALRPTGTVPEQPLNCANADLAGCNWLVDEPEKRCASCELTRTRPADDDVAGLQALAVAESAKRWLLFGLGELNLPIETEGENGLGFELLSSENEPVTPGHATGLITLDLAESDDARRVARREQLAEPYRTVLGHLRHEIGHYYWPILVERPGGELLERGRELVGDEREDYQAALERHYEDGPPPDWPDRFVSAYWAETFAHYLHIRDTLQTAAAYRVRVLGPEAASPARRATELASHPSADKRSFEHQLAAWLPLTYALNALNRSMGRRDLYPFLLNDSVVAKLSFVDAAIDTASRSA